MQAHFLAYPQVEYITVLPDRTAETVEDEPESKRQAGHSSILALCQLCALLTACVCAAEAQGHNQLASAAAGQGCRPLPGHHWPDQQSQAGSTSSAKSAAPD